MCMLTWMGSQWLGWDTPGSVSLLWAHFLPTPLFLFVSPWVISLWYYFCFLMSFLLFHPLLSFHSLLFHLQAPWTPLFPTQWWQHRDCLSIFISLLISSPPLPPYALSPVCVFLLLVPPFWVTFLFWSLQNHYPLNRLCSWLFNTLWADSVQAVWELIGSESAAQCSEGN